MGGKFPSYLNLTPREWKERISKAYALLEECRVCPRECGVNRKKGEKGICRAGFEVEVSSYNAHFGEEPPISGFQGSGTIFFTHCSLRCVFCQNYPISHLGHGKVITLEKLAEFMVSLQKRGCHNINFVTPTHYTPQILASLPLAIEKGLRIPLVHNSGGYERVETLKLFEGVVDIYMPDIKYGGEKEAEKYSSCPDYFEVAKEAIKEMHRQVGDLVLDEEGIALKGLLVRHLVLPRNLSRTREVFSFLKEEVSPHTYISIMSQYFPAYRAFNFPELSRRITGEEYKEALKIAEELGLVCGFRQGIG